MAEYIERDSAAAFAYNCGAIYVSNRLSDKNAFPAADVAPVVHGRWKRYGRNLGECSNCGEIVNIRYNYCPNCGARMDEME